VADGDALATVRQWVADATDVVVLTGAGISAESGVPTFRGWTPEDGDDAPLWSKYRPEELATPGAFARDPTLVWEWYDWRRGLIAATEPNAGHHALVELERRAERFALVTQNVDGHHTRAGSRNVLHLHGDIWTLRCVQCGVEREDRRHSARTGATPCRNSRPPARSAAGCCGPAWCGSERTCRWTTWSAASCWRPSAT
jgi:NAD-dependent deacetylase